MISATVCLPLCTTLLEEAAEEQRSGLLKHLIDGCKRVDLLATAAMPDLKKMLVIVIMLILIARFRGGMGWANARLKQRRSNANVGWADEDLKMRAAGTRRLLRLPRIIICRYPSSSGRFCRRVLFEVHAPAVGE